MNTSSQQQSSSKGRVVLAVILALVAVYLIFNGLVAVAAGIIITQMGEVLAENAQDRAFFDVFSSGNIVLGIVFAILGAIPAWISYRLFKAPPKQDG